MEQKGKAKAKSKAHTLDIEEDDDSSSSDNSDIDFDGGDEGTFGRDRAGIIEEEDGEDVALIDVAESVPMAPATSITHLRAKLHTRMAALHRGGPSREAGDRDELLEERRKQRAALRERRRSATREKIRKEKEGKTRDSEAAGASAKEKAKIVKAKEKEKGAQAKVCITVPSFVFSVVLT